MRGAKPLFAVEYKPLSPRMSFNLTALIFWDNLGF
jgi:hypothetical protein